MELLYKSFPVAGVEAAGDDLKVVGKCSDGAVDHDGDIVSPRWMASAVKEWLATYPAVRLQHRADSPIGKGLEAWQDAEGSTFLKALICDSAAKAMVRQQVLRAFSIGIADPQVRKSARAPRHEIVGGRLAEVSVVDSPSNARCGITVCKSRDGAYTYVGKAFGMAKGRKAKILQKHYDELAALACGCQQCVTKSAGKAAKMAADPGRTTLEKALRSRIEAAALDSSDPWVREAARGLRDRRG